MNGVVGVKSGHFEEIEGPSGSARRRPGRQTEMGENLGDDPGLFDGGDDLEVDATGGQCSTSISNTRLSSRAQLMRAEVE